MTLGRIQRRLSRPISLACGAWDRNDVLAFRKIVIVRTVHCDNHLLCERKKASLNLDNSNIILKRVVLFSWIQ